jgi:hypothetical protein
MEREFMNYPKDNLVSTRGGIKVGFRTYSSEATANECAEAAANNAIIRLEEGYDFGYMWPSEIRKTDQGFYEVTIP